MKKKLTLLTITFAILGWSNNAKTQTPDYLWAKRAGRTSDDRANSVSTDARGNIIATGVFYSSTLSFGTTTLTNAGIDDMFIVKYDASGNVLWAKSAGGTSWDEAASVSTDASGNIIATGYYKSSSITFGTTTLTNAGGSYSIDMFIVKYDTSGNVLWAKSAGGTSDDYGTSVSTTPSGNIIVTGRFSSSTITFGTTTLKNAGGYDMFIVNYDGNGNVLWAKSAGGISDDYGNSISTDASGNMIVTGKFGGSIIFGTTTLTDAGWDDMFIVKYDTSGNIVWAKSAGGTSNSDYGKSVSTDASGNIIATGYFRSSTPSFGTTTLTNAGGADMFIVKYDAGGNVLWAKSARGTNDDEGSSVSTDVSGNIIATGSFESSTITFGTTTLTNAGAGYADMFIVKYDAGGNVLWAKSAGGTDEDWGNSVSTDASGNIIATGSFESSTITFGTTTLTNAGYYDMFIVKLNGTTGIEEDMYRSGFAVYPSPSNGEFTVENYELRCTTYDLKVFNVLGEVMYSEIINNQSTIINLSALPAGIYFLQVNTGEEIMMNRKLVLEK